MSEQARQRGYEIIPKLKDSADVFHDIADGKSDINTHDQVQVVKDVANELYEIFDSMIICPEIQNSSLPAEVLNGNYALTFEDDFGGQLDPDKWCMDFPWGYEETINQEEQIYIDLFDPNFPALYSGINPVSFGPDGELIITGEALPQSIQDQTEHNFTSAVIKTRESKCFKYGYVEVDAKVPCTDGTWPAFWLLNKQYLNNAAENPDALNDKFDPEIDIEFVNPVTGSNTTCVKNALHYFTGDRPADFNNPPPGTNYKRWSLDSNQFISYDLVANQVDSSGNQYIGCDGVLRNTLNEPCSVNYCEDFHKYGILWCDDKLEWYVDGVRVNCIEDPSLIPDQEMYFIANLAIGGTFPDPTGIGVDQSLYPAELVIRSVKIFEKI